MSGTIKSFYLIDSLNVIATHRVGSLKKIIRSTDGGTTWRYTHDLPPNLSDELNFVDASNYFSVLGSSGNLIAKTSDGGNNWSNIILPASVEVVRVQFFTTAIGYVHVNQGSISSPIWRILKTTNGGTDWTTLDTTLGNFRDIEFKDINNGWVFGNSVYRTTDGGSTFNIFPTPPGIETISTVDTWGDNIVFAGYRYFFVPPIYSTRIVQTALSTDRGATWRFKDHGDSAEGDPKKIRFIDSSTIVVLRPWFGSEVSKSILITTDKGLTWSEGNFPENSFFYTDLQILNGRVYTAGSGATFVASGPVISEPWEVRIATEDTPFSCADFNRSGLVVAISAAPQIYISKDKGKNWSKKFCPVFYPSSVLIANDTTVYMTGSEYLFKTDNLFLSFDTVTQVPPYPNNLRIKNNGEIWLTNSGNIFSSSDHGMSWINRYSSTEYFIFSDLEVFDDGTVYASINGSVFKTTNNGGSWMRLVIPLQSAYSLDFYDSKNGFIGNGNNAFYRTKDGGVTFEKLTIPGMTSPKMIHCQDSLTFMLAANQLYSTYDGGWSWKVNEFNTQPDYGWFGWMYMFNQLDGIILGRSKGNVFITSNRGNTPVELSAFTATHSGNKVALQWTTETETNNMGFEIERRYKHGDWKTIAFSKGSGTSTRRIYYGYDDLEAKAPAILYYRLKQIDYDGRFSYSDEVEVILGEVPENYAINQNYPNPFNPNTKVSFSLPEENEVVIRVYNAMGELVKVFNRGILPHGNFDQNIEMGDSPSGIYFCQVFCTNTVSGRTKSLTTKMVLMK